MVAEARLETESGLVFVDRVLPRASADHEDHARAVARSETQVPAEPHAAFPDWRRERPASMSGLPWE